MKNTLAALIIFATQMVFANGGAEAGEHAAAIPFDKIGWQAANLGILLIAIIFLIKSSIKEVFANRRKNFIEQSEKTKTALKKKRNETLHLTLDS